jgi:hypothetical protein
MFGQINKITGNDKSCTCKNRCRLPLCTNVYAADQVLLPEKEEHLQKGVFILNKILESYNIKILKNKSNAEEGWKQSTSVTL